MDLQRRTLLSSAAAAAAGAVAGCPGSVGGRDLPEDCPTTREFDVEWPDGVTRENAEAFVESYGYVYYREVVVDYEPEAMIDGYGLSTHVSDGPVAVDDGYEVTVSGSGGVYRPPLHLAARTADAPSDADVVPVEEVSDDGLRDLLETAAAEGEAETTIETDRERVDHVIEHVASLSEDVEGPHSPGAEDTGYFDVDGTTVELVVQAGTLHGDYWWGARYYVDDHVVWRVDDTEGDPRMDGELLECRREA